MVIVVGGSVSGICTALRLSELGIDCTVFEKSLKPGRKSCGEGLAPLGATLLRELKFDLTRSDGFPFDSFRIVSERGEFFDLPPPGTTNDDHGFGLNRRLFEERLREHLCLRKNVEFKAGEEIRELTRDCGKWKIVSGEKETSAKWAVIASGSAKRLIDVKVNRHQPNLFGSTRWINAVLPPDFTSVMITPVPSGELFVTRTSEKRINVSLLSSNAEVVQRWGSQMSWEALQEFFYSLSIKLDNEEDRSGIGLSVGRRKSPAEESVLCVGDAIEVLDPVGGLGLTHAVLSGRLAAEAIAAALHKGLSPERARWIYSVERERQTARLRLFTSAARLLLRSSSERTRTRILRLSSPLLRRFGPIRFATPH